MAHRWQPRLETGKLELLHNPFSMPQGGLAALDGPPEAVSAHRRFGAMLSAFKFGAPPHGGRAPGIDRMLMLLADEPNLREIIAFPLTQAPKTC